MGLTKRIAQTDPPVPILAHSILVLVEEIEDMKRKIIELDDNKLIPFAIKQEKLAQMRQALLQTEHYTINLMAQMFEVEGGE